MNKDLIKTLVVLALVIAGMAGSIAFFTRQKDNVAPVVQEPVESVSPVVVNLTEGNFEKKGTISLVDGGFLTMMTADGEIRVDVSNTKVVDESGANVSLNFLSRGITVLVKGTSGVVNNIKVISSPNIIIFSPFSNAPVGLTFNIDGSVKTAGGTVMAKLSNRRTKAVYFDETIKITPASKGLYGSFSLPMNLSSALDILDGDMLDMELSQKDQPEKTIISWRYAGGLASKIKVFFFKKDQCGSAVPVDRLIDASKSAIRSGLEEAIKGPSAEEISAGYITALSPDTKIRSLEFEDDIILVDFNSAILEKGPACDIAAARNQIVDTIMQFPTIKKVVISVDGEESNPLNR